MFLPWTTFFKESPYCPRPEKLYFFKYQSSLFIVKTMSANPVAFAETIFSAEREKQKKLEMRGKA